MAKLLLLVFLTLLGMGCKSTLLTKSSTINVANGNADESVNHQMLVLRKFLKMVMLSVIKMPRRTGWGGGMISQSIKVMWPRFLGHHYHKLASK